jgi:hypothetical protein
LHIDHFPKLICFSTFALGTEDIQTVPLEWEEEKPERFWSVVNGIHNAALTVCDEYDCFVKLGMGEIRLK